MPSSEKRRKRKSTKFDKVNHVETDDGWTHVVRGSNLSNSVPRLVGQSLRNGITSERITFAQDAALRRLQNLPSQRVAPTESSFFQLEDLEKALDKARSIWNDDEQSMFPSQVKNLLVDLFNNQLLRKIKNGICLGLGSLSNPTNKGGLLSNASLWQLIFFLDVFHTISAGDDERQPRLFAQDPCFNSTDVAFLSSMGISIVQDNGSNELMTGESFVYAPHFPLTWWPPRLRNGIVPLIIGNDVLDGLSEGKIPKPQNLRKMFEDSRESDIPDLFIEEEFQRLVCAYNRVQLPKFEFKPHSFMFTCLFWRNSNVLGP